MLDMLHDSRDTNGTHICTGGVKKVLKDYLYFPNQQNVNFQKVLNFYQFLLKKRAFLSIFANFRAFFAVFYRFLLAYLTQTPQADMPTLILSSKTNISVKKT